jgi:hypothetical protein
MRLPDDLPVQLPREDVVFIPHVSLQAILVLDSPDVDIRLWNVTVAEMETTGKLSESGARSALSDSLPLRMSGPGLMSYFTFTYRRARRNVNINFAQECGAAPCQHERGSCVYTSRETLRAGQTLLP